MTTLQLQVPAEASTHSFLKQKPRYILRNRWSHGRAYVVIAAIAPLVLLGLLLVHLHATSQQWASFLRLRRTADQSLR